jgi:hypothetical protein
MSQKPLDFLGEEKELYSLFTELSGPVYKFFDLFSFEVTDKPTGVVRFGQSYEDDEVPKEVVKQLRFYIKEQKKALRENPKGFTEKECHKKMFWCTTMLLEHNIFSSSHQSKVMMYSVFVYQQLKDAGED